MDRIKRGELKELIEPRRGPCVSAFLPACAAGAGTSQDPVRLKNLMRRVQVALEQQGCPADLLQCLLRPVRDLACRYSLRPHQPEGIALFSAPGFFRDYSVPFEVPDLVVVAAHFHLKPLLPLVEADSAYYLLALAQNGVRLYRGNRDAIEPADEIALPASPLAPAHEGRADGLQCRGTGPGRRFLALRRLNGRDDQRNQLLLAHFRKIDDTLRNYLEDETPVVLAGVTHLCALYRHASRISSLAAEEIRGNPDRISSEELHRRGLDIACSLRQSFRDKTADEYYQLWHTVRASNDVRNIAEAARDGRVKTLFVAQGVHDGNRPSPRSERDPGAVTGKAPCGDQDLLNNAALDTFLRGGRVFAVPRDLVPGRGRAAAVFRY